MFPDEAERLDSQIHLQAAHRYPFHYDWPDAGHALAGNLHTCLLSSARQVNIIHLFCDVRPFSGGFVVPWANKYFFTDASSLMKNSAGALHYNHPDTF